MLIATSIQRLVRMFIIAGVVLAIASCEQTRSRAKPGAEFEGALRSEVGQSDDLLAVNSLAVLPIEFSDRTRALAQHSSEYYSLLRDAVSSELGLALKTDDELFKRFNTLSGSKRMDQALLYARALGADSILRTVVHEYQERRGSTMAADQMAQFNFSMSVIRVRDGQVVWSSNYNFRDQAATDNLLRLGEQGSGAEKFGFSKASDSLAVALRTAVRDLSDRRSARFQGARG